MNQLYVAQLIVTVVAVLLMLSPLLVLAYIAGRRSAVTGTSRQFDQMRPDVILAAGTWQAEFDVDASGSTEVVLLELQQVGSRVVAVGHSPDGTRHSLEGILLQRRLCCVSIDEHRRGNRVGTISAELQPGEQRIVGMRSRWEPESQSLIIRKATLTRATFQTTALTGVSQSE